MLIYIVEDDTDIRELESYAMKSSGYEVQSFGESKSFFKACTAEIPQLVILDVMLPDFDGLSVLEKMRRDAVTKNVPVILVTAKGSEMDKVKGLDMGADDYNLFQSLSLFQESVQSSADVLLMTDRMSSSSVRLFLTIPSTL